MRVGVSSVGCGGVTSQAGGVSREKFLRPDGWGQWWLWSDLAVVWAGGVRLGQEVQTLVTVVTLARAKASRRGGDGSRLAM